MINSEKNLKKIIVIGYVAFSAINNKKEALIEPLVLIRKTMQKSYYCQFN